jgi:hypothetical protein
MALDKDFILVLSLAIFIVAFLIAGLPLKNWLEINRVNKKELRWMNWLIEKPSKAEYCNMYKQNADNIKCDFCGAGRQLPSLEMVITYKPQFGIFNNTFVKYSHFKAYFCSGCGTELYRERYEE